LSRGISLPEKSGISAAGGANRCGARKKRSMSNDKSKLDEATDKFGAYIDSLAKSVDWACDEIARLRTENWELQKQILELNLKNQNLTYMLRSLTGRLQ